MLLFIIRMIYILICTGAAATYTLGEGTGAPDIVTDHPVWAFAAMVLMCLIVLLVDVLYVILDPRLQRG